MAFTFVRNMISNMSPIAPPKDITKFEVNGSDEVSAGDVLEFDGGEVTLATGTSEALAVIALEDGKGDDDDEIRVQWISPGAVYKCPVNGTFASLAIGKTYAVHSDSSSLAQGTEHGPLTLIGTDDDSESAYVVFNSCLMAVSTRTS